MRFDVAHIIGVGGTGSILLEPLARMLYYHKNGTRNIHIWDADVYEPKNGVRQLFDKRYTGMPKVHAMELQFRHTFPSIIPHAEFVNTLNLTTAVRESPVVIESALIVMTVDNDASRGAMIRAAEELGQEGVLVGLVIPGNGEYTGNVHTFTYLRDRFYPEHPFVKVPQWEEALEMPLPGSCGYEAVSAPQLITANMMAAGWSLYAISKLLDGSPVAYSMDFELKDRAMAIPSGCKPKKISL